MAGGGGGWGWLSVGRVPGRVLMAEQGKGEQGSKLDSLKVSFDII